MKEERFRYKLLVHCRLCQIQKGFTANISSLPVLVEYADLQEEGILSKLRFNPHIIILLFNREDSDLLLPIKVKLFAPDIPILLILPQIPESYLNFLKKIGVEKVVQLPIDEDNIRGVVAEMLDEVNIE